MDGRRSPATPKRPRAPLVATLAAALLALLATTACAEDLEWVIVLPPEPARAAQRLEFAVYLHNRGKSNVSIELPPEVGCRIETRGESISLTATAVSQQGPSPLPVVPGGFATGRYAFVVPENDELQGTVRLSAEAFPGATAAFSVEPRSATPPSTGGKAAAARGGYPSLDSLFSLYQPYLANISAYEPIYFLVGTDPEKSSFQISFKYRLLSPRGSIARAYPWVQGIHLAYTQTSFWDLKSRSTPFDDTSYKPELFMLTPNISARPVWTQGLFVKTGLQHESNGRGMDFSRSTNLLYAETIFILYDSGSRLGLQLAPRVWGYVANDQDTNPDLADYRGYFEVKIKVGRADTFVAGANFRWAREGASVQADLTYPIHRVLADNFDVYFQIQYANALAENLLNYRDRTHALRVGIAFVR